MHLPQTSLEQLLHASRVLLMQLLLYQCFHLWLFCILLLVGLDWCELVFLSSTNLEQSSSDNRKKYLRREIFDPITNLYKMWALIAAKSNIYVVKKLRRPPVRSCIYSVLSGHLVDHISPKFCGIIKFYGFRLRFLVVTCIISKVHCRKQENVFCCFGLDKPSKCSHRL